MQDSALEYKQDFLLELKSSNYSVETVYNYDRDLSLFESFLKKEGLKFEDIDKRLISVYKDFLISKKYLYINENEKSSYKGPRSSDSNSTLNSRSVNRMLSSLRSYLKYLIDFDLPSPLAPEGIKLLKMEKKQSQVVQMNELIRLIECPSEFEHNEILKIRNRAILELLFATGMRISELVRLNRDQFNKEGKIYILGKGKKQRFVYLTPRAANFIVEYLKTRKDNYTALFIPLRGGRNGSVGQRLSINYIQEKIVEYRKRLGIIVPTSAHSLRHGFATYLAEEGASPAAIQILLGHESLHTTDKYVHASDKFAEETHRKYHPLSE